MPYAHGFHASLRKTQHSTQKKRTTSPARSASIILYVPHILKQTPQPELKAQGRIRRIPLLKAISCCFYIVTILLPAYSARTVIPLSSRAAPVRRRPFPLSSSAAMFPAFVPKIFCLRPSTVLTGPTSAHPGLYRLPPSAAFSQHSYLPGYTFKTESYRLSRTRPSTASSCGTSLFRKRRLFQHVHRDAYVGMCD